MPLAAPIDYSVGAPVQTPDGAAIQGLQLGAGLAERDFAMQQRELKFQQDRLAAQRLAEQRSDLAALSTKANPTAKDYGAIVLKYPELKDSFKDTWAAISTEQQKQKLDNAAPVFYALQSGRNDLAESLLQQNLDALKNSNGSPQDIRAAETWLKMVQQAPGQAQTLGGIFLASVMGPDKFTDAFGKIGGERRADQLQPSALTKAEQDARKAKSDADVADVTARYGEQNAVADLARKGWDIKKIEADIKHGVEQNRIANLNALTNRMNAGTQRDEYILKRDEAVEKRNTAVRERVAEVTSARNNIDNMLNTADQVLKHPGMAAAVGSLDSRFPIVGQDAANFESLVENLGAQAFISQIPAMKGMGALSDAEGKKLSAALQSFDLKQSAEQFSANVKEAQRLMLKARSNLKTKYGIPDTVPDTPAALPTKDEVGDLLKKYGATGIPNQ